MEVIDEQGRVFGVVNVVDLLVVLLVLAVVAAGVALVTGGGVGDEPDTESATITVRVENAEPYVAEAVPGPGEIDGGNVTAVENRTVEPATVVTTDDAGELHVREHPRLKTVTLEVTVDATRDGDELTFEEQRLKVGQSVGLDLGPVDVRGNVTSVEAAG